MDKDLNRLLDAYRTPAPSATLRERVLAAAPKPRRRPAFDLFWWASGAGLAAAGVAGVVFGAVLSQPVDGSEALLAEAVSYNEVLPLDGAEVSL
jgi:ferric-dicitrate binding protein FerR (iron transport regulator)